MLVVFLTFVICDGAVYKDKILIIKLSTKKVNQIPKGVFNSVTNYIADEVSYKVTKLVSCLLISCLANLRILVNEITCGIFKVTGQIIVTWSIIVGLVTVIWFSH